MKKNKTYENPSVQDILKEYQEKIFKGNYKLYHGFPLSREDTYKCKILEQNLEFLKKVIYLNAYKNLGYDINNSFGVGDNTLISDLPEHIPNKHKQQDYPFPLNDEFRQKLLFSPKFKFYEEEKVGYLNLFSGRQEYISHVDYYVTSIEHKGKKQVVVLKVKTDYQNKNGSRYLQPYDYSNVNIVALLGKKCKKVMSLARLDYNRSRQGYGHQNFLDENENTINFGQANWRKHLIHGTHFHLQTEKFELLNPNCLGSGTAVEIDDSKGFLALRKEILSKFNFYDLNIKFNDNTNIEKSYDILYKKYLELKGKNKNAEYNK